VQPGPNVSDLAAEEHGFGHLAGVDGPDEFLERAGGIEILTLFVQHLGQVNLRHHRKFVFLAALVNHVLVFAPRPGELAAIAELLRHRVMMDQLLVLLAGVEVQRSQGRLLRTFFLARSAHAWASE